MSHADTMNDANARGLTIAGTVVSVSGARNNVATVTIADRKNPFYGFSAEYSWAAIARATTTGKLGT